VRPGENQEQENDLGQVRFIAGGLAALLIAGSAQAEAPPCAPPADLQLTADDAGRLKDLPASRARGLAAVKREADAEVGGVVARLFEGGPRPLSAVEPGKYRCRTIKLGSQIAGLQSVVYGYFACTIKTDAEGWTLAKVSGSQNFTGTLTPAGEGLLFKGASHYGYEKPRRYGDDPEHDLVGCLLAAPSGARHYILELPSPALESLHDVIELEPAR
jgi:hypothetical protein